MTWVNTVSGRRFDLLTPRAEDVCLTDIAHALSRLNRYNGHIKPVSYSVGEHSVRCAMAARHMKLPHALQMACLLHDAHEAYIGDITSPMKQALRATRLGVGVYGIQRKVDVAIVEALCPQPIDLENEHVLQIDAWFIGFEAPRLLEMRDDWSFKPPRIKALDDYKQNEIGWGVRRSKCNFLKVYRYLLNQLSERPKRASSVAVRALTESARA